MQLIVVRHAATEYNEKELINGSLDDDRLSTGGLAQIGGIIESLAGYSFDVVYTSSMNRAVETASPIAEHFKVPLHEDPRIGEVNLGSFNGQGWSATIPAFGLNSSQLLSSCEYDFTSYGGESAEQTRQRVQAFIDDVRQRPTERPLIVSHGGIMRWFYYLCTGEKAGRIPNGTVYTFSI